MRSAAAGTMAKQKQTSSDTTVRRSPSAIIPVIEEKVETGIRRTVTGRVRVTKRVEQRRENVDVPVTRTEVEVRRVPVNQPVNRPPVVRRQGDTLIIPVLEEELVITRRLVLREEIHVTSRRTRARHRESVNLRRERAIVERSEA